MNKPRQYWFPAKKFGWGWGPPRVWQGWVVVILSLAMVALGALRLLPLHPIAFLFYTLIIAGVLTFICYITGEPPQWRWGDKAP